MFDFDTVTLPEDEPGNLKLADIIDTRVLRSIMQSFFDLTGIAGAVLDISGEILVQVGFQDICARFHRCHPEACKNCLESDTILSSGLLEGECKAYRCKNNLWDMVTPLFIGGRHLGNVFIGQFFYDQEIPDRELFRNQAQQYGFNEEEYLDALARVPHVSKEQANSGIQFYARIARVISKLSYSAIEQSRLLEEGKRTEVALRRSEVEFRRVVEASPVAIYFSRLEADGRLIFLHANASFDRLMGVSHKKFLGKPVEEVLPNLRGTKTQREVAMGKIGPKSWEGPYSDDHVDGYFALHLYQTAPRTVAVNIEDITERKRTEEKMAQLNEELMQNSLELEKRVKERTAQLEHAYQELEAFSYSVSHDLRSPLRSINGWSLALEEDYSFILDKTAHGYLKTIRSETQHMGQLIDDLLMLAQTSRAVIERSSLNLSAMAKSITQRLRNAHPKRRIDFDIMPDMIIEGDSRLLGIVLKNLFENAVKFTGPRPQATIQFGCKWETVTENKERFPVFFIRDNGVGFSESSADKLFKVFQRLHKKKDFPGTGIGLVTVQRIIHRHGGRIWAKSKVNKGATFYFTLPWTGDDNFLEKHPGSD